MMICILFQRVGVVIQDKDDSEHCVSLKQLKGYNLLKFVDFATAT